MHDRPVTWTGRGLRLGYVGDIVLAATAAIYFLNYSGRLAGFGFVLAGLVGLFSVQKMWGGRNEFGPAHAKNVKRGLVLFFVGGILFFYALLAGLTNVPETLDFKNMRPPVLAVGLALIAETASGALFLYELVGSKRRPYAIGYGVVGAVSGILLLVFGMAEINEFEAAQLHTAEIAQDRLMMFLDGYLPYVMAAFLVTRLWAIGLLRHARKEVEIAEHDAMQEPEPVAATSDSPPAG